MVTFRTRIIKTFHNFTSSTTFLGVTFYLSLVAIGSCRDEFIDGKYYKTGEDLAKIPNGIPEEAVEVYLSGNKFRSIPDYSFSNSNNAPFLTYLRI